VLERLHRARGTAGGQHGFGQPRADVDLTPAARGAEFIEAQPGHHPHQERLRIAHTIGGDPPPIGVLEDVLGLAGRAEHPVRHREQPVPHSLERPGR
jgi:hypothetical protein